MMPLIDQENPMVSAIMMKAEKLTIRGRFAAGDFTGWIIHRARRLGLRGGIVRINDHHIEILVAGPPDLIDAMEVSCSLGPISVEVDCIDRAIVDFDPAMDGFAYISNH